MQSASRVGGAQRNAGSRGGPSPLRESQPATNGDTGSSGPRWSWGALVVIGLLLLIHALLAGDAARGHTVTHDEYWHLPVGLLNLRTNRFDYETLNPPLGRMWAALPLLAAGTPIEGGPIADNPAGFGDRLLDADPAGYRRTLLLGRLMIVLLSVLTGVLLAVWSRSWFGERAACLTVFLWAASPPALAHGSLVTTDMAAALLFTATLWTTVRFAQQPGRRRGIALGVVLGLAQLVKYTCVLLYPLVLVVYFATPQRERIPFRSVCLRGLGVALVSLLVLNAGYLFRGSFRPLADYGFRSQAMRAIQSSAGPLARVPLPVPRDWLSGIDNQRRVMEAKHPVYLNGQWSLDGFRTYYLWAWLYKVPHATQLLTLFGIAGLWFSGRRRELIVLLLPVLVLLAIASFSGMQLGLRYLLPVFPLLLLLAGQSAGLIDWKHRKVRSIAVVLLIVCIPVPLKYHPHYISYFNSLAGGPEHGAWYLLDSNLDWGQDLDRLRTYSMNDPSGPGGEKLKLAYFGTFPPASLGIDYELPPRPVRRPDGFPQPGWSPQPGWYAVSINFVQGRPHGIRDAQRNTVSVGPYEFSYLKFFQPVKRIGTSILVYHLTEQDVLHWQMETRRDSPRR